MLYGVLVGVLGDQDAGVEEPLGDRAVLVAQLIDAVQVAPVAEPAQHAFTVGAQRELAVADVVVPDQPALIPEQRRRLGDLDPHRAPAEVMHRSAPGMRASSNREETKAASRSETRLSSARCSDQSQSHAG